MQRLFLAGFLLYAFVYRINPPLQPGTPPLPVGLAATIAVTPALGQVPGVKVQGANNNLDVVRAGGRTYLAFRTAPNHFASRDTHLYVVSSADEQRWKLETSVALGSDVREPRLLPLGDRLFLYFAVLGRDLFSFEPHGMMGVERAPDGRWGAPRPVYLPGYIPWRTKVAGGRPYMLAYGDGRHIYTRDGRPVQVHWLTTDDGWRWRAAVPGHPVVLEGGGSEADFELLPGGGVVAVIRNEAGDGAGWGSKVCRAEAATPGDWRCRDDGRKFDSPLLFRHGDRVFLVARRNLRGNGDYDLHLRRLPATLQTLAYQLEYWRHPKRCALWSVDADELVVDWLADLPSRGDTCFPAVVPAGGNQYTIYNYSSPIDAQGIGPDIPWLAGQLGRTDIYRTVVTLPGGG
jgi:hypothetical protein